MGYQSDKEFHRYYTDLARKKQGHHREGDEPNKQRNTRIARIGVLVLAVAIVLWIALRLR